MNKTRNRNQILIDLVKNAETLELLSIKFQNVLFYDANIAGLRITYDHNEKITKVTLP